MRIWMLDAGCLILDARFSILDVGFENITGDRRPDMGFAMRETRLKTWDVR